MTVLDKKVRAAAKKAVDKYGTTCTLTRDTGTPNPITGDITEQITISTPVKCTPLWPAKAENWPNDIIEQSDTETFIAATDTALVLGGFVPELNMKFNLVSLSTELWNIQRVKISSSGDLAAGYLILLRK